MQTGKAFLSNIHFRKTSGGIKRCNGQFGLDFPSETRPHIHTDTHAHCQATPCSGPWASAETKFLSGGQFPFHYTNVMLHFTKTQHAPIFQVSEEGSLKCIVTFKMLSISTLSEHVFYQALPWLGSTRPISSSWAVPQLSAMLPAGVVTVSSPTYDIWGLP